MNMSFPKCSVVIVIAVSLASRPSSAVQYKFTSIGSVGPTIGPIYGGFSSPSLPFGGLVADAFGNLYGATPVGGAAQSGTIYEVTAGLHSLKLLTTFDGTNGSGPWNPMVVDASGNLFGATAGGGSHNAGAVFEIDAATHSFSNLVSFQLPGGVNPGTGLVADSSGNIFGSTQGVASVFELSAGTRSFSSSFITNGASNPVLVATDADGNIYGTSPQGGVNFDGLIFEIPKGTLNQTTLAVFNGSNGWLPQPYLTLDKAGNLFGITQGDGTHNYGTVFEIAAGTHAFTNLTTFGKGADSYPNCLIIDSNGNLFGTTAGYGATGGTVFEITAGTHSYSTLFTFPSPAQDPNTLILDAYGDLLGTTAQGGTSNDGIVFELATGTHAFSTLASFNGTNGVFPTGGLVFDPNGDVFGTAGLGGTNNDGTVFELTPVPEPGALAMVLSGIVVSFAFLAKRFRAQ